MRLKMHTSRFAMLCIGTMVALTSHARADVLVNSIECTVARIAERYITMNYPDFDSIRSPPIVRDKGTNWEVEYQLPITMIGGTPVIIIEKANLKVLKAYHTQ